MRFEMQLNIFGGQNKRLISIFWDLEPQNKLPIANNNQIRVNFIEHATTIQCIQKVRWSDCKYVRKTSSEKGKREHERGREGGYILHNGQES